MNNKQKKKADEDKDVFNRVFLGTPTIGGIIIIGAIIIYIIYNMFFKK